MRKAILLSIALAIPALSGPIMIAEPIYMTGSGAFHWSFGGGFSETVIASGSTLSSGDTASLFIPFDSVDENSFFPFPGLPVAVGPLDGGCFVWSGSATVDGISGGDPCSVGNKSFGASAVAADRVTILDSSHQSPDYRQSDRLLSYGSVTDPFNGNMLVGVDANFTIIPTPEPARLVYV